MINTLTGKNSHKEIMIKLNKCFKQLENIGGLVAHIEQCQSSFSYSIPVNSTDTCIKVKPGGDKSSKKKLNRLLVL